MTTGKTGTMRQVLIGAGAVVLGSMMWTAPAQAAPVTFHYTVTIDQIDDPGGGLFGGPLKVGDKVQGYFTYDTTAPDDLPGEPTQGYYQMFGGISAFGLLTPRPLESTEFWVNVANDSFGVDSLTVQGYTPVTAPGFDDTGYMDLNIRDASGTWLSSDAPPANLSLAQVAGFQTWLSFQGTKTDAKYTLVGHLTYDGPTDPPTPPAVPEPASLVLLGSGLLGMVKLRRTRR
jgi:hypothetical protein